MFDSSNILDDNNILTCFLLFAGTTKNSRLNAERHVVKVILPPASVLERLFTVDFLIDTIKQFLNSYYHAPAHREGTLHQQLLQSVSSMSVYVYIVPTRRCDQSKTKQLGVSK